MRTKKEMMIELRRKELLLRKLSFQKKKQKELLDYLTQTNYILFKFAQEINHHFDVKNIVDSALGILKEHFSEDSHIFLDEERLSISGFGYKEWLLSLESIRSLDIKEVMELQKILYLPYTVHPNDFIGEHNEKLLKETNKGFQSLYKKWFDEKFKKTSFFAFLNICKNNNLSFTEEPLQEVVEKVRTNVREKQIYCHHNKISSLAAIPLIKDNKTIGYIQITGKNGKRIIEEQIPLLTTLANLTVVAVSNVEKYHKDVYIDHTTGFPRKRLLFKYLEEALRHREEFSVIVTDLDNFKQYVDKNGHQAGQKAINDCGFLIKSKIDKEAKLAVLGGDEYIIYLPRTNKKLAEYIGEDIRKSVSNYLFDKEKEGENKIKISVGVADVTDIDSISLEEQKKEIIKKADDALFRAKRAGRDRVCVWIKP
jgi:diguanylate cyclase (GGDEF)-like protein